MVVAGVVVVFAHWLMCPLLQISTLVFEHIDVLESNKLTPGLL